MTVRAPFAPWLGALLLLAIATIFASNHVAARLAFDHGTSVAAAVTVRSFATVFAVLGLLAATRSRLRLPGATAGRALAIGLLLTVQSYCLYAAVARLPVALALLTFNLFPIILALIAWIATGQRPGRRALIAMPVILSGLVLALDVFGLRGRPAGAVSGAAAGAVSGAAAGATAGEGPGFAQRWTEIGSGVGFALAAATAFAAALFLTNRWLGAVDGRLRALYTMATVAVAILAVGGAADVLGWITDTDGHRTAVFTFPNSAAGWTGLALLSGFFAVAFTSLFVLLPRLGAVSNAPILNFEPIAAMALGALILGQNVTPIQIAGALVVIGGIVFLATGPRR